MLWKLLLETVTALNRYLITNLDTRIESKIFNKVTINQFCRKIHTGMFVLEFLFNIKAKRIDCAKF